MKLRQLGISSFNLNYRGNPAYTGRDDWGTEECTGKIAGTARPTTALQAGVCGHRELWHCQALTDALKLAGLANECNLLVPPDPEEKRSFAAHW